MKNLVTLTLIDKPSEKTTLSDLNLNEIPGDDIHFKSVEGIYDGPLTGTCEWRGSEYFFSECWELGVSVPVKRFPQYYLVVEFTPEQKLQKKELDKQLEEIKLEILHKKIAKEEYYRKLEKISPQISIRKNQIVGWFSSLRRDGSDTHFRQEYFEYT
jgi:hypothetical protein